MSVVYVVQSPRRRDAETGEFKPQFNLEPAAQFGEIRVLLGPEERAFDPPPVLDKLCRGLLHFVPDEDYLLLTGNPSFIGWACAIAAEKHEYGLLQILQWQPLQRCYSPVRAEIFTPLQAA